MTKVRYVNDRSIDAPAKFIAERINRHLDEGNKVVWCLSGGSAIDVAVETARRLAVPLDNFSVCLADERFGPPGHKDSNWQALLAAGFKLAGARLEPVLRGQAAEETVDYFNNLIGTL